MISAASITDAEFSALTILSATYDVPTYTALLAVLDAREMISGVRDRLRYEFLAHSVALDATAAPPAKSNIYIGSVLE